MIDAVQAMATAAAWLGRPSLATMIAFNRMTARGVLVCLQESLHPDLAAHAAIILIAAGYASPESWESSGLKAAVAALCSDDEAAFEDCRRQVEAALG